MCNEMDECVWNVNMFSPAPHGRARLYNDNSS